MPGLRCCSLSLAQMREIRRHMRYSKKVMVAWNAKRVASVDSPHETRLTIVRTLLRSPTRELALMLQRAVLLPGCNSGFAQCCESSGNQQLSGPPGAGVLPATNQLAGERSEPKSWGQIGAVNVV